MPRRPSASTTKPKAKPIAQYQHTDKQRPNNPPVGLVDSSTDPVEAQKTYAYDPHLDPALQWAGKAERASFQVPTVSLHVHERIDPRTILEAVRAPRGPQFEQMGLFASARENPPLREAIDFYKHPHGWSNRLIAGDSVLVMNSLLEKEGLAGQVQMVYFDPPYGIKYGSNFQPFVNKRDIVSSDKDEDLTVEPEMLKAFRDTWELGIHSYLSYLRDRLLLAHELLNESGSVFVQISDENLHLVRALLDEVFGSKNFCTLVTFRKKTMPLGSNYFEQVSDYIVWYAKDVQKVKTRPLFREATAQGDGLYKWVQMPDGKRRAMIKDEINNHSLLPASSKVYRLVSMLPAQYRPNQDFVFRFEGKDYFPPKKSCWKTTKEGMDALAKAKRLQAEGNSLQYILFFDDYPVSRITALWADTAGASGKMYVVQTSNEVVERSVLATTDPGDLVLDITCGSGTTAYVAEQWGRRWVTCDTSRIALTLAKQRLMTAVYDYYQLAHPDEGVGSGFRYKTVPHITLKSIANNEPAETETLYDQPLIDNSKTRITGPFTMEAVPSPLVKSPAELNGQPIAEPHPADASVARSGETFRQSEWRAELLRAGIRGKGGQMIRFSRVEPLAGTRWLHAEAETLPNDNGVGKKIKEGAAREAQRAVISFGPEFAPLEQRQVEAALEEAQRLIPKPRLVIFTAFQFDAEAAKDIDEANWPGVALLKAQMNADLFTDDLKKKRSSNESFWLIGQPDVVLRKIHKGEAIGQWELEVYGFDYYNTLSGDLESGGADQIAMWLLDTDYDGRSLFPRQVFFPMAGEKEGWAKLARNLRAEIDEDLIEAYRGTVSLPFELGPHKRVAVKIVDARGIESLKIVYVD